MDYAEERTNEELIRKRNIGENYKPEPRRDAWRLKVEGAGEQSGKPWAHVSSAPTFLLPEMTRPFRGGNKLGS